MGNKNINRVKTEGFPTKSKEESNNISEKIEKLSLSERDKTAQNNEEKVIKIVKKHNKENQDAKLIDECLAKHFFFCSLEKQARSEIIRELSQCFALKGTIIFKQGDIGNYYYIISEGRVELIINGERKKEIKKGENFGELALIYDVPRSGTIKTLTDCYMWIMEKRNFKKIVSHITHITFEQNKKFFQGVPIYPIIEYEQRTILFNNLYKEEYNQGQKIIGKGEMNYCMFFIKEGEVNVINSEKNQIVRTLKRGDYFGEREIILNEESRFDIISKTKCTVYAISSTTLYQILGNNFESVLLLNFIKNALLRSNNFKKFNVKLLDQVGDLVTAKLVMKEQVIYQSGFNTSSAMITLVDGELYNGKDKTSIAQRGTLLFEDDILNHTNRKIDFPIISSNDCLVVEIDVDKFEKYFKCSIKELLDKSSAIERLKQVHLFKTFTNAKLENLSEKIKIEKITNGKNVITQGEEGTRFYIVKSGKVDIFVRDKYIRTMNENEYLGERALFFKEPRSATAKANGDCEVFYLEKDDFISVIETNLKDYLMSRLYLQDNTVQLQDLEFYDRLGNGNYGLVSLVKSKKNKYFYAIKNISNKQILYSQLAQNLELERGILLQIDHPFIVKLVKTLKDENYVYFLMDYIKGKELFDVIRDIGLLNKSQAQFYGASLMLAVEYLHERKFIYRDIKPENVMVLENGYIKLIDFGTAKAITDKTATIIGTPHYMAPEVILGDGYSFQVDFWSIAICIYEFVCGAVPFGETAEEPMDVYLSIINE